MSAGVIRFLLSSTFAPLLNAAERYLVLCGGGGSGKTEFAATKLIIRTQVEGGHRFLVLRKIRSRCRESVVEVFLRQLISHEIRHRYNKSDRVLEIWNNVGVRSEILFDGLDDPEKIKSIKGLTGIWLEETTEFTEKDFLQLDLRLREPTKFYKQIILSFNPDEEKAPWLKKMFFDHVRPGARISETTIEDNPIEELRESYLRDQLEPLKDQNPTMYEIYRLGKWAIARGKIYKWDVDLAWDPKAKFDDIWYGLDFGFSISEAGVLRIYRRGKTIWLEEVIYELGLTNQALGMKMKREGVKPLDDVYCDAAEPKSIQELSDLGINAKPSEKGADSVRSGILFLQALDIRIVPGSENLIKEARIYSWAEDKEGRPLPKPVKYRDHLMDAARIGITTHLRDFKAEAIAVVTRDVRPD